MSPTTAKLKHDIDRGRGGDKVEVIVPAAAPLGTDDEAPGTPPGPTAIKQAYAHEISSSPISSERNDSDHAVLIYLTIIVMWAAGLATALWVTA
jgi:hypothetical protein